MMNDVTGNSIMMNVTWLHFDQSTEHDDPQMMSSGHTISLNSGK